MSKSKNNIRVVLGANMPFMLEPSFLRTNLSWGAKGLWTFIVSEYGESESHICEFCARTDEERGFMNELIDAGMLIIRKD